MKRIVLEVDGMKCGMCEAHINDIVRRSCKVKTVTSSRKKRQTVIVCDDVLNPEEIKSAIEQDGYKVLKITEESYVKRGFFRK